MSSKMSFNGTDRGSRSSRILVVRLGSMGDVVHTLPAVAWLKSRLPDAELSWVIEPQWACLLEGNPHVDRVIEAPLRRWRAQPLRRTTWLEFRALRKDLRQERFDLAVDFQGLLKSALITYLSGSHSVYGFDRKALREPPAASLYSGRVAARAAHVVDRNLELASAAASALDTAAAGFAAASEGAVSFPLPLGKPGSDLPEGDFVLAGPLAGWESKQWPPESFAELAAILHRETGMPLVIDCAPADRPRVERILRLAPAGSCRLHASSIEGLIAATRRARAVVGVDSGPLHLAAALQAPGVAIFGPTDPARNGPYGSSFRVLRATDATTSYKRRAEIDPSMRSIEPREVWAALAPMLGEKVLNEKASPAESAERVSATP